jgi:hypothetical protein
MDETTVTVEATEVKEPFKHQAGKFVVSGIAAFLADQLAAAAYDKVLNAVRARKAR